MRFSRSNTLASMNRFFETVKQQVLGHANEPAVDEVQINLTRKLTELRAWATRQATTATDPQQRAHLLYAAAQIRKFEQEPAQVLKPTPTLDAPPGAPIGSTE